MNFKRIYAIFIRQVYLVRYNITRLVQMLIWATVDIVLWGFISRYLGTVIGNGFSFVSLFLGAVLLWNFLIQVMQGVTVSFFEDVWSRNFLNIFASPLKISEYLTGLVLTGIARSILALGVMLAIASLIFGFSILALGITLALFLMILFLFGIALGIIGVSIVLRLGPSAEWFIWPIPALLSPFVGVLYPLEILPVWMQYVGHALPPSYVFSGVRTIMRGGAIPAASLVFGTMLALIYIFIAYGIFVSVFRKAVKRGLIARYSAETLS